MKMHKMPMKKSKGSGYKMGSAYKMVNRKSEKMTMSKKSSKGYKKM